MIFMKLAILKTKEFKNASWLIGGKVAQMLLSLVVTVFSARYLGPSNYGLINYGVSLCNFFMAFCTLGINSVIVKEFLDNPDKQGEALGSSILARILSSICSIFLIIGVSFLLDYGEWETILVVALCSISLLFHAFDTINCWFQSRYQSNVTALVTFVAYAVMSVYKIVLLVTSRSVFWFAFATSVDYIALAALLLVAYKKNNGPKMCVSVERGKAILGKSYHYILSGMMVSIYSQTDKLMLKQMLGDSEVGYYTVAVSLCTLWTFVLSAIIDSMYPSIVKAYEKGESEFHKKNRQLYAMVFYISICASLFFVVVGEYVVQILYGKEFLPAATPLKITTWYTAFSFLGVARNAWMVCNQKQKYIKYTYIFAIFINIGLNALLIPLWGVEGAALASLVTQIFTSIILPFFIKPIRRNSVLMLEAIMLRGIMPSKAKSTKKNTI